MILSGSEKVIISFKELKDILLEAAKLGAQAYEAENNIAKDMISESAVKKYLKAKGIKIGKLEILKQEGYLKPVRKGTARNSAKMYSMLELQAAIATINNYQNIVLK